MLPTITGLYAGICAFFVVFLAANVAGNRRRHSIGLGDGNNPKMLTAIRLHANAIEYIPFTLLMMAFVEIQHGVSTMGLHIIGLTLLGSRVLHVIGLISSPGYSPGRFLGISLNWLLLIALGIINIGLFLEFK